MRHLRGRTWKESFLTMTSAAALIAASVTMAAPARRRRRRQPAVDRQRIPALDAVEGRSAEGAAVVRKGRRSPSRAWKSTSCRKRSRRTNTNRRTLAKAFTEITGIKLKHDLIQEGDVVEKLQTQMQSGKNVYDGWINDSDLIGTHFRYGQTIVAVGLHDRRGQGRHQSRRSTSTTSSAGPSPQARTRSSISCRTSSSPTSIGSATTGSPIRTTRPSSRPSTATISACR